MSIDTRPSAARHRTTPAAPRRGRPARRRRPLGNPV
ncbi:ABC transporter permease, partial [Streptomyces sp. FT05W]